MTSSHPIEDSVRGVDARTAAVAGDRIDTGSLDTGSLDTGLLSLCGIAAFFRIAADPEKLRRELPLHGRAAGADLEALRSRIALILQGFLHYSFSASENIGVGVGIGIGVGAIARLDEREKIVDAAERALADRVIGLLPLGYAQPLGRRFKDGIELSGGEWQKMATCWSSTSRRRRSTPGPSTRCSSGSANYPKGGPV